MANLPEKNITQVDEITSVPANSKLFVNANGEFRQATVNEVVKSSTVVTSAVENAINTAVEDGVNSHFKQTTGSPILLTDTADGTLIDFKGKGRSTQKQYSGKNFLKCSLTTAITQNGITFTPVYDGKNLLYINVNGTATDNAYTTIASNVTIPSGTYILNGCPSGGGESTYKMYTNSLNYFDYGNGATFTLNAEYTFANLVIYVFKGQTLNNLKFYPMIRLASVTDATYEPYVGGVASPNPDYPQAIKSVADSGYFDGELLNGYYNSSTGEYVSQASGRICSKNPIPCKGGDIVKIVLENNVSNMYICCYNESGFISMLYGTENANFIEKTIPNGATYFTFWAVNSGMTVDTVGHITVTINGKYALIVKSVGKNLLSINEIDKATSLFTYTEYTNECVKASANITFRGAFICSFSAYLEKGKRYIFSQESINLNSAYIYSDRLWGNNIGIVDVVTAPNYTHNADSGIYIIGYYNDVTSGKEYSIVKPMLRLAEITDATYEPYKETVTYIPLNEPLRSNLDGTVTDEVSLTEINRRFAEVVLDGSDDEVIVAFGNGYPHLFRISVNGVKETRVNVICTHFLSHRKANSDYSKNMIYTFNDHILINHMDITTVAEFKAWLQANPITVQYELAEPIVETIEPVDIVTYDNVTYLTASDNAEMELEYPTSKVAGIASIGYSKGRKAEYEVELLKAQLLELQTAMVNSL